jgi:hypothetical protein
MALPQAARKKWSMKLDLERLQSPAIIASILAPSHFSSEKSREEDHSQRNNLLQGLIGVDATLTQSLDG